MNSFKTPVAGSRFRLVRPNNITGREVGATGTVLSQDTPNSYFIKWDTDALTVSGWTKAGAIHRYDAGWFKGGWLEIIDDRPHDWEEFLEFL